MIIALWLTPNKSNYILYNGVKVAITINGQNLENCTVDIYFGVYFDNKLFWNSDVDYVLKLCFQRMACLKEY